MIELLRAMIVVLLSWAVLGLLCLGFGTWVRHLLGLRLERVDHILLSFWVGWACIILVLQLWHLGMPMDYRAFALIATFGIAGLAWNWRALCRPLCALKSRRAVFFLALIFATWLSNRATDAPRPYDYGLYYEQTVLWINSHPVVPGLGNVHGRLAFNNSNFLYVAMLEGGPWRERSAHVANGLLLFVLFIQALAGCRRLLTSRHKFRLEDAFLTIFLAPVLHQAAESNVSHPSPDLVIFILGAVIFIELLALIVKSHPTAIEAGYRVLVVAILATLGVTVQLSFVVVAALALPFGIFAFLTRYGKLVNRRQRNLAFALGAAGCGLLIIPWMARSVVLSGYVAYPVRAFAVPVDWRIPEVLAIREENRIRRAARAATHMTMDRALGSMDWLSPWMSRLKKYAEFEVFVPLSLALGSGLVMLLLKRTRHYKNSTPGHFYFLLLLPAAHLIFWSQTAPNPRFAGVSFWAIGSALGALALNNIGVSVGKKTSLVIFLSLMLTLLGLHYRATSPEPRAFRDLFVRQPGDDHGFHIAPAFEGHARATRSGLLVHLPLKGERCWDAPLPCTPPREFKANLSLRDAENLGGGFRFDSWDDSQVHESWLR